LKKFCFYIILVILVVIIGLQFTGSIKVKVILDALRIVPTEEETIQIVYTALKAGDAIALVKCSGNKEELKDYAKEIVEKAFLIDDESTSDDYDYMKNKYRGYTASIRGIGIYIMKYEFDYSETGVQTQWVNERVKEILKALELEDKSEYEKIKRIHDYIIDNISYDITAKNNSAYEGLKNGITACQGYANLAYKLFTEAGIHARIVTGIADGEAHAWNIVRIGDLWYNIDCTWDDPIGGSNHDRRYDYFLKNNAQFMEHIRDEEYDTEEFNTKYRMADESWQIE